jgi:hypothetical protein
VVFPLLEGKPFNIPRPDKWGGPIDIASYDELRDMYATEKLAPGDLKSGVAVAINKLLDPIRQKFQKSKELRELVFKAYPEDGSTSCVVVCCVVFVCVCVCVCVYVCVCVCVVQGIVSSVAFRGV